MKKFVGIVNGKTFHNEKDFNEAATKAVKENDGQLSISSYYKYDTDDTQTDSLSCSTKNEAKDLECPRRTDPKSKNVLPKTEYVLDDNATKDSQGYELTNELYKKLSVADNKAEIVKVVKEIVKNLKNDAQTNIKELNEIFYQISDLQEEQKTRRSKESDINARIDYYNKVLDIVENENPKDGLKLFKDYKNDLWDILEIYNMLR